MAGLLDVNVLVALFDPAHLNHDEDGHASLLDPETIRPELIGSYKQIKDIALLAQAVRNDGKLVTFDRSIPVKAVAGATPDHLQILGAGHAKRTR